jgi:tRNA (guanine37-N1)-methyltransferase
VRCAILTLFPEAIRPYLDESILGIAQAQGNLRVDLVDFRNYAYDPHRTVDDRPFGGGPGMVLKPEPLFKAVEHIRATRGKPGAVVLTSPQGRTLTQADAARLAALEHVVVLCGRYEGVDERVREHVATDEISIGDYVLSGGELAAMVIIDVVSRLIPGVVGDERSVDEDSFARGLLDHPHYTRPAEFRGWTVPDVLLSGHHGEIERWRRNEALRRTLERRPELLSGEGADHERD